MEELLREKFGTFWEEILFEYLEKKAMQDPGYMAKVNNYLLKGISSLYKNEREERSDIEKGFVSALACLDKKQVDLKKNVIFKPIINETLDNVKCFKIEDIREKLFMEG